MAEAQQSGSSAGFTRTVVRKALAPLAHAAVTAGSAYLARKAIHLWQEKVQPRIEERGGGRSFAKKTLHDVADKSGPASGAVSTLADKVGGDEAGSKSKSKSKSSSNLEANQRRRRQRRNERRRTLEQTGSS